MLEELLELGEPMLEELIELGQLLKLGEQCVRRSKRARRTNRT